MEIKLKSFSLVFFLFFNSMVSAQHVIKNNIISKKEQVNKTMELTVGDSVPNFFLGQIINNKHKISEFSELKDKLLIIDFWSINCKGCVLSLPRMDSLQQQFRSKILILPVTYEKKDYVLNFWKANKFTKNLRLPSIVEDTLFSHYFKHKSIPHEVWIYKGKVIAITSSEYVDEFNIKKVLSNQLINWPVKYDFYNYDFSVPLFFTDTNQINLRDSTFQYASVRDYKEGINYDGLSGGGGIIRDSINNRIRVFFINQPIYQSYQMLLDKVCNDSELVKPSPVIHSNQILWDVKDRSRYQYRSKTESGYEQEWIRKNAVCYESVFRNEGQNDIEIYKKVLKDLDVLFGLQVKWVKRKEKVLILSTKNNSKTYTKTPVDGISLNNLIYLMNERDINPYVFNSINDQLYLPKNFYNLNLTDVAELNKNMNQYGLEFKTIYKEVDKLLFTEVKDGLLVKKY